MTEPRALRVVVADDQTSVRQGLTLLLDGLSDIEVVAAAADGREAVDLVIEHRPDALLLDLHMPVLDGIGAIRRLADEQITVAVVVLTTLADDTSVRDALHAGARSYLTKDADRDAIAHALHAAVDGLTVLDARVHGALFDDGPPRWTRRTPAPDDLTPREVEILGFIAAGLTNAEIAAKLYLSTHTIKSHVNRIFAKTGSRDRAAAIGYAHRHDLG